MTVQRGKKMRVIGAALLLLLLCVIPITEAKAETLEDKVVQTVAFEEFDQLTINYQIPTVLKMELKEKGTFELDFSPKTVKVGGILYDEQGKEIGNWGFNYKECLKGTNYGPGIYYLRLWTDSSVESGTYSYYAHFTPTSNSSIEICITLKKGKSVQLDTIFTNSKDKKVTWSSSKSSVATVSSSGKVTAKKKGTTIIKVFNSSGLVSKIKVKVTG